MRGALCVAKHLYILYVAADESISGWEFLLLIPKSPLNTVFGNLSGKRRELEVEACDVHFITGISNDCYAGVTIVGNE